MIIARMSRVVSMLFHRTKKLTDDEERASDVRLKQWRDRAPRHSVQRLVMRHLRQRDNGARTGPIEPILETVHKDGKS
jgi:hypothetical protein